MKYLVWVLYCALWYCIIHLVIGAIQAGIRTMIGLVIVVFIGYAITELGYMLVRACGRRI